MKILDIALKDLLRSFRSLFAVGMMVVAPIMITALIYFAFGGLSSGTSDLPAIKVGIVNLDVPPADAPEGVAIGGSIRDMFFDDSVKSWLTASDYADEAAARAAVNGQEIGVAVIVPAGVTATALSGEGSREILILQDPTLSITPVIVRSMVSSLLDGVSGGGIAFRVISQRLQENGQSLQPAAIPALMNNYATWYADFQRNLFHHPEKAALVIAAPSAAAEAQTDPLSSMVGSIFVGQMIFFAFYTGAYAMMSILREDEEGTLARLFTTPTDRTSILSGKFVAVFLTVVLQGVDDGRALCLQRDVGGTGRSGADAGWAGDCGGGAGCASHLIHQNHQAGRPDAWRRSDHPRYAQRFIHHEYEHAACIHDDQFPNPPGLGHERLDADPGRAARR